jgi:F-type H+-transporting ATPase subunit delta
MSEQASKIPTVFDSEAQHVGEVYAKALLSAAAGSQQVDEVVDQLEAIVTQVLDANPKLELLLSNPKMPLETKWAMIDRLFGGKINGSLLNLLKVLGRRERLQFLRAVQLSASEMRDEWMGRIQVQVTVPNPLDAEAEKALIEKLQGVFRKQVRLSVKVDPGIVGGLVIRIGDTVFDGSVDGQLRMLRKSVAVRAENALRSAASTLVQAG